MFRFTELFSGKISKQCIIVKHYGMDPIKILAIQAQSINKNIPVLCVDIWPDGVSVNRNMSPSF